MTTPHKSTKEPHEKTEVVETFIPLYEKNVERLADLEKKSLEMAAEQNAEWIEACKKTFRVTPETPGFFLFDLLDQTFERLVETEKEVIDLAVEQSHAVAGLAKERGASATKTGGRRDRTIPAAPWSTLLQRKRRCWIITQSSIKPPTRLPRSNSASPGAPPPRLSRAAWTR